MFKIKSITLPSQEKIPCVYDTMYVSERRFVDVVFILHFYYILNSNSIGLIQHESIREKSLWCDTRFQAETLFRGRWKKVPETIEWLTDINLLSLLTSLELAPKLCNFFHTRAQTRSTILKSEVIEFSEYVLWWVLFWVCSKKQWGVFCIRLRSK